MGSAFTTVLHDEPDSGQGRAVPPRVGHLQLLPILQLKVREIECYDTRSVNRPLPIRRCVIKREQAFSAHHSVSLKRRTPYTSILPEHVNSVNYKCLL